jgi:hypothetical protein
MTYIREMPGSPYPIGIDEEVQFSINFANWGGDPSSPSTKLYDIHDEFTDVSSTMLSGSASESGDIVTTPTIKLLEENVSYMMITQVTISGQKMSCYGILEAER